MKTNRENLVKALETVKPGLSNKDIIEQSSSFCFMNGEVVTFNDEISVRCPVDDIGLAGAVNAEEIYSLLTKIKQEEIDIEVLENEVIVKSGKVKAGILFQPDIVLPVEEIGKISKWKKVPENFLKGIEFVLPCCSDDMVKPVLTAIHIKESCVEAADNFRLSRIDLASPFPMEVLISKNAIPILLRLKPTMVAEGENSWIHFKTKEGTIISIRVFEEKYPDLTPFLSNKGTDLELPEQFDTILERASVFYKQQHSNDEVVTISIEQGKAIVKAKNEAGWFEEKAKINYSGEPFQLCITPKLLLPILNETNVCKIDNNRIVFKGENWVFVAILRKL
jgi:DNA polymerase III sliding clamp (beta) subunit (PCNA family)